MSKLVDKERLAKLAKALDDRAKAAVAAEKERALAAEQAIEAKADANAAAIEAINHAETGILAEAKKFAAAEDAKVAQAAEEARGVLEGRIETLEGIVSGEEGKTLGQIIEDVAGNTAAIEKLNGTAEEEGSVAKKIADAIEPVQGEVDAVEGRVAALEADAPVKQAAIEAAQAAANKAQGEVDAVELRVDELEAFVEGHSHEGLQGEIDAVELRVDALEAFKNGHSHATMEQGIADNKAAIEKEVDDREAAVEAVQGEVDALEAVVGKAAEGEEPATGLFLAMEQGDAKALQDAKTYADQQIAALVDSAPEAMNTLNELAGAIEAHQDVYDAYVAEVSGKLDKKVDKVEGSRLVAETEIAAFNAKAEVSQVNQALQDAKDYADAEDAKIEGRMDAVEAKDVEQDGRLADLEAMMGLGGEEGEKTALEEIREDIVALGEKDTALQGEIDALEERLDAEGGLVDRIEAVEEFKNGHSHDALQGEIDAVEGRMDAVEAFVQAHSHEAMEQGIADNAAAIEAEVKEGGARDAAIAAALEEYSTTEEMKGIIGNVVNSLALTMEDDKVVLKLGGVDGIALTSVSLDMATDADIDAIVAGLDAE